VHRETDFTNADNSAKEFNSKFWPGTQWGAKHLTTMSVYVQPMTPGFRFFYFS